MQNKNFNSHKGRERYPANNISPSTPEAEKKEFGSSVMLKMELLSITAFLQSIIFSVYVS